MKLMEGCTAKFCNSGGRDRISGLTGEVGLHAHNGPKI